MGARQAVEVVERRGDRGGRRRRRARGRATRPSTCRCGSPRPAGFVDEVVAPGRHPRADRLRAGDALDDASPQSGRAPRGRSSRATPPRTAILAAAREALAERAYEGLTMDAIARRAFVSRTAVYFYFPNKRAVVDRLIQQAFSDMYLAAARPTSTATATRARELRQALGARVMGVVDRNASVLLPGGRALGRARTTCRRSGRRTSSASSTRAELRIAPRPGARHRARRHRRRASRPGAVAMVERHITRELVLRRRRRHRVDPRARRAVVARGLLAARGHRGVGGLGVVAPARRRRARAEAGSSFAVIPTVR